jgi:N-acetylmuramoyl-L-alanine amidase
MREITVNYLTPNQFSRPKLALKPVKALVIHWVENPGTGAMMNRNFFENRKYGKTGYGSAHFIVDLSGEIVQCIPIGEVAYHVGAAQYNDGIADRFGPWPNNCTIGIETCHIDKFGKYTQETLEAAQELAAHLCQIFSLQPVYDILRHYDYTGKICPRWFVDHPLDFALFKQGAKKILLAMDCKNEKNGDC